MKVKRLIQIIDSILAMQEEIDALRKRVDELEKRHNVEGQEISDGARIFCGELRL